MVLIYIGEWYTCGTGIEFSTWLVHHLVVTDGTEVHRSMDDSKCIPQQHLAQQATSNRCNQSGLK